MPRAVQACRAVIAPGAKVFDIHEQSFIFPITCEHKDSRRIKGM
jgi:hypothetical protein